MSLRPSLMIAPSLTTAPTLTTAIMQDVEVHRKRLLNPIWAAAGVICVLLVLATVVAEKIGNRQRTSSTAIKACSTAAILLATAAAWLCTVVQLVSDYSLDETSNGRVLFKPTDAGSGFWEHSKREDLRNSLTAVTVTTIILIVALASTACTLVSEVIELLLHIELLQKPLTLAVTGGYIGHGDRDRPAAEAPPGIDAV